MYPEVIVRDPRRPLAHSDACMQTHEGWLTSYSNTAPTPMVTGKSGEEEGIPSLSHEIGSRWAVRNGGSARNRVQAKKPYISEL